jgi:O-antigen/teichoic acid export membrane protein
MKLPSVARLLRANVLLAAASFVTSVLLARTLEPEARGVLANVILWPTFLAHISLCGVPVYLSREMAGRPENAAAYYRRGYIALFIAIGLAILLYAALLVVGADVVGAGAGPAGTLIAILIIPFSAWNALQVQMELGRMSIGSYTFACGSFTIVYLLSIAGLWAVQSRDLGAYLGAFVIAAAAGAVSTHWLINRSLSYVRAQQPLGESLWETFRASAPFAVSVGLIALASSADRIAISLFFDAHALGVYVVALALTQVQSIINEAVSPLFFASMARNDHIAQTDPGWLAMKLRQSLLINAGICAALVIAAPVLVPLIYGRLYEPALPILSLLLPAMCARGMMRPFEEVLKGINRPLGQSLAITVITGVFFPSAAVGAWFGSVRGVALALLAASLAGLVMAAVLVSRECRINLSQLVALRVGDVAGLFSEFRRMVEG